MPDVDMRDVFGEVPHWLFPTGVATKARTFYGEDILVSKSNPLRAVRRVLVGVFTPDFAYACYEAEFVVPIGNPNEHGVQSVSARVFAKHCGLTDQQGAWEFLNGRWPRKLRSVDFPPFSPN